MQPVDLALKPNSKIPYDCVIDCYNINIYLQPLIDELKELCHLGIEMYEISASKAFQLKVALYDHHLFPDIWNVI